MKKTVKVLLVVLLGFALLLGGGLLGLRFAADRLGGILPVMSTSEESSHSVSVSSVIPRGEVALLSLRTNDIHTEKRATQIGAAEESFFSFTLPGSEKAIIKQYSYDAKLGIDGSKVKIEPSGEKSYTVTIPEFIVIGTADFESKTLDEDNGVLSFVTEDIDTDAMVTDAQSEGAKERLIDGNEQILADQAEFFYTNIIRAVDPEITLNFEFADPAAR